MKHVLFFIFVALTSCGKAQVSDCQRLQIENDSLQAKVDRLTRSLNTLTVKKSAEIQAAQTKNSPEKTASHTTRDGKTYPIQTGPRGGRFYINDKGVKTYVK